MKNSHQIMIGVVAVLLLVLTAWGNALGMFMVSSIGLMICLVGFGGDTVARKLWAAAVAAAVAMAVAMIVTIGRTG